MTASQIVHTSASWRKSFFSAAAKPTQRHGGKATYSPEKVASVQKQTTEKSVPSPAAKVSHSDTDTNTSSGKLSSKVFLVVGTCSALVIGFLTLFPWEFPKNFNVEEKKEDGSKLLSEDADRRKSADVSFTSSDEAKSEKGSLNELNHQLVAKREESSNVDSDMKKVDSPDTEPRHTQNAENLSALAVPTKPESDSNESISSAGDSHAGDKVLGATSTEDQIPEVESKNNSSQLMGHVPAANLITANISHGSNGIQSSLASGKEDDVFSDFNTSSLTTKESGGLSEDLINKKEPNSVQVPVKGAKRRPSLFEAYYLANRTHIQDEDLATQNIDGLKSQSHKGKQKPSGIKGGVLVDETHTDTVRNAFDLLEVVHAAELRQADLDAQFYAEVQKRLKQSFQQELKDAQAKELMYAEEANRLAKEIELEKQRAVTVLELELEKTRESLHKVLKQKEEETELRLKKADLLSKTQIAAAVAEEKLSYLKDVKDVRQQLEALYTAFFTQSEEVRQSHTIHKLSVGTFALEDAMKRGVQVQKEMALICSSYEDTSSDPLLDAVISSIPEHVVKKGTMTPFQLQQKFETIKGEVLELSLIPATGGGLLSHAAAKMVSILKVKETGHHVDGLDGVVSQVQRLLTDGKLADAADLLEKSVQGTAAEVLAADWVKCVRERAVLEQMLMLLQAHATAIASSLA